MLRANFDNTIVFHSQIEKTVSGIIFYFIEKENEELSKHDSVLQIILFYRYKGLYILLYRLNLLEFKILKFCAALKRIIFSSDDISLVPKSKLLIYASFSKKIVM